jgi:hypothetical protein
LAQGIAYGSFPWRQNGAEQQPIGVLPDTLRKQAMECKRTDANSGGRAGIKHYDIKLFLTNQLKNG